MVPSKEDRGLRILYTHSGVLISGVVSILGVCLRSVSKDCGSRILYTHYFYTSAQVLKPSNVQLRMLLF